MSLGWPLLPEATASTLLGKQAAAVIDIYGSTETGGIAARCFPGPNHQLLAHWRRGDDGQCIARLASVSDGQALPLPDSVNWHEQRTFTIGSRLDGALKIAGTNVFPAHIAEVFSSHPKVRRCSVRAVTPSHPAETVRLKAFIVPENAGVLAAQSAIEELRVELELFAGKHLSTPQRPVRIDFGEVLPTGPMGKSADW